MKKSVEKTNPSKKFNKILKDIKDVKIQGATNIAKAGIRAFILNPTKQGKKQIIQTRPTEPLMQNAINFLQKTKNKKTASKKFLNYIKISGAKTSKTGAKLIKNNMNVFTHCHSSTVIDILKQAKKNKKKFVVYTIEVEPLLQGRMTAKELAKAGIKVIVFPDLAAERALIQCDLFLFGVDAYTKKGVANKIGTSMLCKSAKEFKIPRYACGVSFKFSKTKIKFETRPSKEVWDTTNKKIKIINPAFDFTRKKFISGTISEFGIQPFNTFIKKAKKNLKKFF